MKKIIFLLIGVFLFIACEKTPKKPNLKGEWDCFCARFTFLDSTHLIVDLHGSISFNLGESSYSLSYDVITDSLEPPNDTIEISCIKEYETGKYSYTCFYHPPTGSILSMTSPYWDGIITFKPNTDATWTTRYKLHADDVLDFPDIGGCNKKGNFRMHWTRK